MIPWNDKYKPKILDDIVLPETPSNLRHQLEEFMEKEFVSGNLLCYGAPGQGKSALINVLIHKIIVNRHDINAPGRKTEDIESLAKWLMYAKHDSNQKIVKMEEMDQLSTQAQTLLKDGLMEKYRGNTAFLATTNHIEKLDPAIVSRFNTKIDFNTTLNFDDMFNRLKYILNSEAVIFKEEELKKYIRTHSKVGMREIINMIESASHGGTFKPEHSITVQHTQTLPLVNSTTSTSDLDKEIARLDAKYDKSVLSMAETAKELNMDVKTLQRHVKDKSPYIPKYINQSSTRIVFPIRKIAQHLMNI